jgi:type I restriction enzyme S subunit
MQNGWTTTKLGELIRTLKGYAFKSQWYSVKGVPLVKVSNFTDDAIDTAGLARIPNEIAVNYSRYELKTDDVVIQTVGSWATNPLSVVGKVIRVPRKANGALLNQNAVKIIPEESIDNKFLFYALRSLSFKNYIIGCAQGAASQASITLDAIRNYDFCFPQLKHQRRIAAILSAYDDLNENNRRRIQLLEEMARRIYEEWFVHFRFPGHDNARMIESKFGLIPENWELVTLSSLIDIDKGVSYNGVGLTPDGKPMVNLKNINAGGGFRRDATKPYSGIYKSRHVVKPGDIVLANTDLTQAGNVVGSPAIVPEITGEDILISHHIFAIRLKQLPKIWKFFLYNLFLLDRFKGFAKGHASGTTVLGLPREGILNFAFPMPTTDLIKQFDNVAAPLYTLAEKLNRKNENLRRTRDLLLPKLISGEIDVSNFPEPMSD